MRVEESWINHGKSNARFAIAPLPRAASHAQNVLSLTTNLFTIFGRLQYRDPEAVQLLTEKLREHRQYAAAADWASFVLACARVAPRDHAVMSDLLDEAVDAVRRQQSSMTPKQWLDVVCSLCELKHAPADIVLDTLRTGAAPLLRNGKKYLRRFVTKYLHDIVQYAAFCCCVDTKQRHHPLVLTQFAAN